MGGKQSTAASAATTSSTSSSSSPINMMNPSSNNNNPSSLIRQQHRSNVMAGTSAQYHQHHGHHHRSSLNPHHLVSNDSRQRARSLSHVPLSGDAGAIGIPSVMTANGLFDSPADSDASSTTPDDFSTPGNSLENALLFGGRVYAAHSLPTQLSSAFNGIKCPVCCKFVIPDDLEYHLVMCLTKPRISYNEDVLTEDKGECVICLDDLQQGDTIARLPCLCIYHKCCIDSWFEVNRSCPEHPSD